jgi:c-di-GMP-binding flagellar brake protein YcgR
MSPHRQQARVFLPEFGGIPAVVDFGTDRASAFLMARPIRALTNSVGQVVTIEVTTPRGLLHFDARISGVPQGEELELEVLGNSQVIQRREFVRVDAIVDVTITPIPRDGMKIEGSTLNLSGSGAIVSKVGKLNAGDGIDIAMRLGPRGPAIVAGGRVVREFEHGVRAVHFEHLLETDRDQIVRFVFERQRLELQQMRRRS